MTLTVGVDACRGKWLAVALQDGVFAGARFGSTVSVLAAFWPDATAIGVDIPIGLPDAPGREADRAAREFVGERRSSVFPTFPRAILEAPTYEEAKAACIARGWPRPSLQSYGMRHRILEVDAAAAADERIVEVHPEVSFRELAGRDLPPKRNAEGAVARRAALRGVGIEVPDDLPYPVEDVLDATVAAWSAARYAAGAARTLGKAGRTGAIWY